MSDWIPCTDRLPEQDEEVIVTIFDSHGDNDFVYVTSAWYYDGIWVSNNQRIADEVVAWLPLPKPFG